MCKCDPTKRTPFCGGPGCEWPSPIGAYEVQQRTIEAERTAFIAAITKLADDADFRRSFLTHYELWLHPPMMVTTNPDGSPFDFSNTPGGIHCLTEEEAKRLAFAGPLGLRPDQTLVPFGNGAIGAWIKENVDLQRDGAFVGDPRGEPGVLK